MKVNMAWIFAMFVTIIVGCVLIVQVASDTTVLTTPHTITNESLTIVREAADQLSVNETINLSTTYDDWVSGTLTISYWNGTAMVEDTDYRYFEDTEVINFLNSSLLYASGNESGVGYQFYSESYIDDSGARSVVPLIVILFSISIALGVIAYLRRESEGIF